MVSLIYFLLCTFAYLPNVLILKLRNLSQGSGVGEGYNEGQNSAAACKPSHVDQLFFILETAKMKIENRRGENTAKREAG